MASVSRVVNAVNWRSALAEFLLIFVGILAALATAEWDDRRREREAEEVFLIQLRNYLQDDLTEFGATLAKLRSSEARVELLIEELASERPYRPELDALFGGVYGVMISTINDAPYENLKARGLDLIRDDDLRLAIIELYDRDYERLADANVQHQAINNMVNRPFFLRHFRDLDFNVSATPIDYEALRQDPFMVNLVDYRLAALRGNSLSAHEQAIAGAREVVALIDAWLVAHE